MKTRALHRSGGFTLVELMVAVTIGLLLTVTVAQIFVGSRRTYSTSDDLARMQENMRYTHDLLNRIVRMSSYMAYPGNSPVDIDVIKGIFPTTKRALDGTDGNSSAVDKVDKPDSLIVRLQGTGDPAGKADGETTDCLGNVVDPLTISTNIFTINTTTNSLECEIGDGKPVVLVSDVENMQILYGEETSGDFATDRYVPRGEVGNMDRVMSVRISLLFRTPNRFVRSEPDKGKYQMLGGSVDAPTGDEATRIRRTMTMTIALRNRSP